MAYKKSLIASLVIVSLVSAGLFFISQKQQRFILDTSACIYTDTFYDFEEFASTEAGFAIKNFSEEEVDFRPIQKWKIDDQVLVWKNKKTGRYVLDQRVFSALRSSNVASLYPGEKQEIIGHLQLTNLLDEQYRTIVLFLLQSTAVTTFIHSDADVCLNQEQSSEVYYTANFSAIHAYCTNVCVDQPYHFSILINKQTGEIITTSITPDYYYSY